MAKLAAINPADKKVIMTFNEILKSLRSEMESELTRLLFNVK